MKKGRGKPRQFTESATVQIVMEAERKKTFTLFCYENDTTPSDLLREMIEEKLKQNNL